MSGLEWRNHIPIPVGNTRLYRDLYEIEVWLRRIAVAALMLAHGAEWRDRLPEELAARAKQHVNQLRRRTYLDTENSSNVVWVLTLEDLRRLLLDDGIWPLTTRLTRANRRTLAASLEELREIRNIVAHHRAVSPRTLMIFNDAASTVRRDIDHFKEVVGLTRVKHGDRWDRPAGEAADDFLSTVVRAHAPDAWWLTDDRHDFYVLHTVSRARGWARIEDLLDAMEPVRHLVLAVVLTDENTTTAPDEPVLIWPKSLTSDEHVSVVEAFARVFASVLFDLDTPYAEQAPQFACDPLIWFERWPSDDS